MESVLKVSVQEIGATAEELEVIGELLRDELLGLDVESVRRLSEEEAPAGARGMDVPALGGLLVSLPTTPTMQAALIEALRGWLRRPRQDFAIRSVHLEIDGDVLALSQVSGEQQERLIEDWLQRRGNDLAKTEASNGEANT
ncbi:hypothetical protein GCM10009789_66220 [Kribbella sancticallisti]|uniref:Uncharacterized protein n=1 Tax=Kribbella sancticallisti TaxID=460087 RepID=A0ABN2EC11_9ACTN